MVPKVSVIVPVFNVQQYLHRCMDSLLNQSLKDIEIILVNDGSPDDCPEICEQYRKSDSRVKVINKANEGLGFARNSGLGIASGEYISFIDSDDYVELGMLEGLYNTCKQTDSDTVFCGFNHVSTEMKKRPVREVEKVTSFDSNAQIIDILVNMIGTEPSYAVDRKYQMSVWHALYSKKIIDLFSVQFYSERKFISEDIFFHIDYLIHSQKVTYIPDTFYNYCENGASLSASFRPDRFEKYKTLHEEISWRIAAISPNSQQRVDRLFIGYVRSLIFQISNYENTYYEKQEALKLICEDPIWQIIFSRYPFKELPFKYRIVLIAIKRCWVKILLIISKLKS